MARPTEYQQDYCERVIEYGKQGKSLAWMAAELGVSRECIYEWMRVHPEFSDAMTRARLESQRWWEDAGQQGMLMEKGFNASVWSRSMSARFPDDWRESKGVELTGKDRGPVEIVDGFRLVPLTSDA